MTLLELAAATAGTWIVAIHICEGAIQNAHHLLCFSPAPDQPGHELHREIGMLKELLEAGAEVVQARLAVRRLAEPILGALAVAGKAHVAFLAVTRQCVALILAEFQLLGRRDQLDEVIVPNVAQEEVRLHEMVARIYIAVVFDG